MSDIYDVFTRELQSGGRILDAGCGSGRDAKAFMEMGYQVDAFDASPAMVTLARRHTGLDVKCIGFSDVSVRKTYDGGWCCASLLHVPYAELPDAVSNLALSLRDGGIMYASFKYGAQDRQDKGRIFTDLDEARVSDVINSNNGLHLTAAWTTEDARPDRVTKWLNVLAVK